MKKIPFLSLSVFKSLFFASSLVILCQNLSSVKVKSPTNFSFLKEKERNKAHLPKNTVYHGTANTAFASSNISI